MNELEKHVAELLKDPAFRREYEKQIQAEKKRKEAEEHWRIVDRDNYMEEAYG